MFRKMTELEKALRGPPAHFTAPPTTCGGPSPLGPISTPTWIRFAMLTSVQTVIVPETPEDKRQCHLEQNGSPRLSLQLPGEGLTQPPSTSPGQTTLWRVPEWDRSGGLGILAEA